MRARRSACPGAAPKRFAIYTRKWPTRGRELGFKSLDAQRESCLAYIQQQPGWVLVESSKRLCRSP